jgi:hypothetical protein
MIPVPPTSIKFTHEEDARLRALAALLGWSKCKVIRASLDFVDHSVKHPSSQDLPEIVILARLALFNRANPGVLQRQIEKIAGIRTRDKSKPALSRHRE